MNKTLNTICIAVIVAVIGLWACANFVIIRVPLGVVGVRTQQYDILGQKGVDPKDYEPGWHRALGLLDSWELFDTTVQTLELTKDPRRGDRKERDDVRIKTADGNPVSVDITVKYRIKPGEAHQIYQLLGAGDAYKTFVRRESFDAFRIAYGALRTEDFYDPVARGKRTSDSLRRLRAKMDPSHVEIVDILVRDVEFDPAYERKIREKKLADQDVELNKSEAVAAEMEGITNKILAETEAMVKVISSEKEAALLTMRAQTDKEIAQISAEAQKYVTEAKADVDLFAAEQIAKGSLLEKEAEAKGETLKAQALQGSGGANYVAREAARNINLSDITVSSIDTPFLDVSAMTERLGAKSK